MSPAKNQDRRDLRYLLRWPDPKGGPPPPIKWRKKHGAALRAWRKAQEYSAADMAAILGVSRQALHKIESGRLIDPPHGSLIRLAEILGVVHHG